MCVTALSHVLLLYVFIRDLLGLVSNLLFPHSCLFVSVCRIINCHGMFSRFLCQDSTHIDSFI